MFAWLSLLAKPVVEIHSQFLAFRQEQLREITITSSVNRLTRALQDKFNNPGIYLVHPLDYVNSAYVYQTIEPRLPEFDFLLEEDHEPVEYDFLLNELDRDYDFIVRVPSVLALSVQNITSYVAKYVMAGRRFKIELY